ncbi:MAG: hypothetical protein ACI4KO_04120 [Ruminiclostridium sp.]
MKVLKIFVILAVGALSLFAAVRFTDSYVIEVKEEEKTLAEIIMQNQLEAELNKAQEQAKEELGEALVTTVMETKPVTRETIPATTEATAPPETTPQVTTSVTSEITTNLTTTEPQEEEIITEFTRGGILPANSIGIGFKTLFTLSSSEKTRLTRFLIDRYFLDGDVYVENESRPTLKVKKAAANEMEKSIISALNITLSAIDTSDITSVMTADYNSICNEITAIRDNFIQEYKDVEKHGESFGRFYNESIKVLDRMIQAVNKLKNTSDEYKNSTNPILAALILAKAVEDVIIPEIMNVLEQSFGLIEISQEIFLEGTQGTRLLSRDEVSSIITNPALVLDSGLA